MKYSIHTKKILLLILFFIRNNFVSLAAAQPSIALVTISTPNRQAFAQYSLEAFKKYCAQWNYDLHTFDKNLAPERLIEWSKIKAVQTVLETKKYHWVAWFDDDIFITNPTISLQKFIGEAGDQKHFIIGENILCRTDDFCHYVNSGLFLVKNSTWSREFLRQVWDIGYSRYNTKSPELEESAIGELLLESPKYSKSPHIHIFPARRLQSFLLTLQRKSPLEHRPQSQWIPGDFAAHMARENEFFRTCYMQQLTQNPNVYPTLPSIFKQSCTTDPKDCKPPLSIVVMSTPTRNRTKNNECAASLSDYTRRWGYKMMWNNTVPGSKTSPTQNHLKNVLDTFKAQSLDWICLVDESAVIGNVTVPLESYIQKYGEQTDIILVAQRCHTQKRRSSQDPAVLLLKNTPHVMQFLETNMKSSRSPKTGSLIDCAQSAAARGEICFARVPDEKMRSLLEAT